LATSSWAAEVPSEPGREGSAAGASAGVVRKGGEGDHDRRWVDGTVAWSPPTVGGGGWRGCRIDVPRPTTSVGTRTDYSVGTRTDSWRAG
jgi:hypothetical protein